MPHNSQIHNNSQIHKTSQIQNKPTSRLYAYLHPLSPTLFYPLHSLPVPKIPYNPCGLKIPHAMGFNALQHIANPKAIVIFIGGFCDTIMRAVFREFASFKAESCLKIYASFKSRTLFASWLPVLMKQNLPLFVITHSWGASNFYKALCDIQNSCLIALHYLLTLDPVGFTPHTHRPNGIRLWENIYIKNKSKNPRRPNIIALIGHPWNEVAISDYNAFLDSTSLDSTSLDFACHHASIHQMIQASHFMKELHNIIKA
ncbi:hypothetical protein [Helicobacter cinaedi]|uniref:hypothetical protein n=1 Tax=Helicobacter cinaedi TaxID=213 RepID=UPI000DA116A0|nr:hypothetical protein [Helicobacter cinaedi]